MTALLIPPINPTAKTIIDLDQGQQIIIDKDTHFGRVQNRLDDPNPATAINIEPSGTCWSFTFEDGVWWCNEYVGDAQRRPQLQKKIRATEEERIERERARREWGERTRGSMPGNPGVPSNAQPYPGRYDPNPRMPSVNSQTDQRFPEAGQRFPEAEADNFVHAQGNAGANHFPAPSFFASNTTHRHEEGFYNPAMYDTQNFGPPPVPVIPHQGWVPPQPSFPPGFPFHSDSRSRSRSPSLSRGFPMPPSPPGPVDPSHPSSWSQSQHQMPDARFPIHGGNYVQMNGNRENMYVNQSLDVTGNYNNVNWIGK